MCEKHCEGLTPSECYFLFERRGRARQPLKLNYTNNYSVLHGEVEVKQKSDHSE